MKPREIVPHLYALPLGFVNAFLIDSGELTLIDTGIASSAPKILDGLRQLGYQPADLKHVLITHLHADHTGGLKQIWQASRARVHMHPLDAADYESGLTMRMVEPGPGLLSRLIVSAIWHRDQPNRQAVKVDEPLTDGQVLDFAGGLRVIHTPGHTAGHVVFLYPGGGGVLIAGDTCGNLAGLNYSILYEDLAEGRRSLEKIGRESFERAVFAHGRALHGAGAAFRARWLL